MEFDQMKKPPQVGHSMDSSDAKYISGLSTLLVATIQEAKDRISQIEYIFCSQLYPNFQKNSKCLQKLYSEARKAADGEWKQKESQLQQQLKDICLEKERALEECESLKQNKSKFVRRMTELEEKLLHKSKEVDEGMELHGKLLQLVDSKTSIIANKDRQLKVQEEKMENLLSKVGCLERKINSLEEEVREKNAETARGKELRGDLLGQIESQALKIADSEEMYTNCQKQKKELEARLKSKEASFEALKENLRRKNIEMEEGRKLQEQLAQQVKLSGFELKKTKQQLNEYENEKKQLSSRLKDLENKIEELRCSPGCTIDAVRGRSDSDKNSGSKAHSELSIERQKRRDVVAAYKRLKSQYNFVCAKFGLTTENTLPQMKIEGENDGSSHHQKNVTSSGVQNTSMVHNMPAVEIGKVKKEISSEDNNNEVEIPGINQTSSGSPSSSNTPAETNYEAKRKLGSSVGTKRPASSWRATRSRHSPGGLDPHDDFLDTPYENLRRNHNKASREEVHGVPAPVSKDMDCDNSDDETQEPNVQTQAPRPGAKGFKYVEPVRKKAERENLKGVECKQCSKFYDAVLHNGNGKDAEGSKGQHHCEHHDGVSRHRYRYVPPMTPEGFWNIGFDTET